METFLRRHLWMLDLVVVSTAAVLAAHATAHAADARLLRLVAGDATPGGPAPVPTARRLVDADAGEAIVRRNIFCSACRESPRDRRASAARDDGPVPPLPPLRLLAVMLAPPPADPRRSVAVIKDEGGGTGAYSVGSPVAGAVLEAIGETTVLLRFPDGRTGALALLEGAAPPWHRGACSPVAAPAGAEAGIEKCGENRYGVRRATVESLLGKMDTLPAQARFEPDRRDGATIGFRLRDVQDDGVFARIGLRDGDLISSVNGLATNGDDNALAIYASVRSAAHLSVGLERAGRHITAEYDIE